MTDKNSQPLDGVKCVVNTCHYHIMGGICVVQMKSKSNLGMLLVRRKLTAPHLGQMMNVMLEDKKRQDFPA